jgi:3'-phosphoadenosine 5'-phosphosulfate (PAPS) 3'-phosphatase
VRDSAARMGVGSVTPAGGAGLKVVEVLRGREDVYLHQTIVKKWDLCAGDAILRASGGMMTEWDGQPLSYASAQDAVVTGGVLASLHHHKRALEAVAKNFDVAAIRAANAPAAAAANAAGAPPSNPAPAKH